MILSELIYAFKNDYTLENIKRGTKEIRLLDKQIALMLSKVCSDIQKKFGVIELVKSITVVSGTDKYDLNTSVLEIRSVTNGEIVLVKKSTDWFNKQVAASGTPIYYTLLFNTVLPQLWFYPKPSTDDTITVNYIPNYNLYSPAQATAGDFGNFGIGDSGTVTGFSGNTVFPTKYDTLILLGLMKQMFEGMEGDYLKESVLLRAKQFNGEKLDYNMNGVI